MVDLEEKLSILAAAAKYDASCASSGSPSSFGSRGAYPAPRERRSRAGQAVPDRFGVTVPAGVCHSWTGDGRCVSLLKVLYSNICRFDCAYCANRASAGIPRVSFTPAELVQITCEFYRRNYIEGLFLSSGIFADPGAVMDRLIAVAKILRTREGYGGYIHLKIIPGAGEDKIREAGFWADRLSANIELPTEKSLRVLAPQKSGKQIFAAMNEMDLASRETGEDRRRGLTSAPVFAPAGQSTQMVVGASGEDDRTIIGLAAALYRRYSLRRVYYSAYTPVGSLPACSAGSGEPEGFNETGGTSAPRKLLVREHRLYQADWLMRFYRFLPEEILGAEDSFLDPAVDPKSAWALRHLDRFPLEIKRASYEELLRVPGIGAKSARRIVEIRRQRSLGFDGLGRLGVVLKRARYFITLNGHFLDRPDNPRRLRGILAGEEGGLQLPLFEF
jgi:putative DNA modification/repair radical SAM protein